jgi:hypothetical protein
MLRFAKIRMCEMSDNPFYFCQVGPFPIGSNPTRTSSPFFLECYLLNRQYWYCWNIFADACCYVSRQISGSCACTFEGIASWIEYNTSILHHGGVLLSPGHIERLLFIATKGEALLRGCPRDWMARERENTGFCFHYVRRDRSVAKFHASAEGFQISADQIQNPEISSAHDEIILGQLSLSLTLSTTSSFTNCHQQSKRGWDNCSRWPCRCDVRAIYTYKSIIKAKLGVKLSWIACQWRYLHESS